MSTHQEYTFYAEACKELFEHGKRLAQIYVKYGRNETAVTIRATTKESLEAYQTAAFPYDGTRNEQEEATSAMQQVYSQLFGALKEYGPPPDEDPEAEVSYSSHEQSLLQKTFSNWEVSDFEAAMSSQLYTRLTPLTQLQFQLRALQIQEQCKDSDEIWGPSSGGLNRHRRVGADIRRRKRKQRLRGRVSTTILLPDARIHAMRKILNQLHYVDAFLHILTKPKRIQLAIDRHIIQDPASLLKDIYYRLEKARKHMTCLLPGVEVEHDDEMEDPTIMLARIDKVLVRIVEQAEERLSEGRGRDCDEIAMVVGERFWELRSVLLDVED